ncbi:E3 ubiquitin-protein ligase rnf213-alpha isoform X2 [Synchiropus splendidus]|uniref:E3 ubiquitin-protein ligase rnf213-alpha isoform X2 n=1 Tax=Synchiropus splendidus TaxID=270530 RepID=UPI00237EC007|nr:E3 ubiquitin-protein ligase rnf213-alpha isoform X2 [Synchiropus splendidus]
MSVRHTACGVQGEEHVGFALEGSVQLLQQLTRLQGGPSPKRPRNAPGAASGWSETRDPHSVTMTEKLIDPSKGQPGSSVTDLNNPEQNSLPKMNTPAENSNPITDLLDASVDNNPKKRKKKKRKNQKKNGSILLSDPGQGQSDVSQEKTPNEASSEGESSAEEMPHLPTEGSTPVESKTKSSSETAVLPPDAEKQSKKRNMPNRNDKDATATQMPDENANMETQAKQKKLQETKSKDKTQKQTNQMQTTASVKSDEKSKEGDKVPTVEKIKGDHVETQQPESGEDSAPSQKAEAKESEDSQEPEFEPPTIRRSCNMETPRNKRITIHFHAILSNDFKFNTDVDKIFVRAGRIIGGWGENIAELSVSRNLGEHGLLVEGVMEARKDVTVSESIPYKYVIYKHKNKKKERYQFEYIYKLDSSHTTNRSLFVKPHLLTDAGDWHQYDDIICVEPTMTSLQWWTDRFWFEQKKSVVDGRNIAGDVMLHRIFDLLTDWSGQNMKSFMMQLSQFFQVYGNPYIYEDKNKRWTSLQYGEDDVRNLMKEFLLLNLTPQMLKGRENTSPYVRDPLKAALVFLYVGLTYRIKLQQSEFDTLCALLCLPHLPKDFCQYWAKLSEVIAVLGDLPTMLIRLMSKTKSLTWTLVLPLLHLVQGCTNPFEVQSPSNLKYGKVWAGLPEFAVDTPLSDCDAKILWGMFLQRAHLFKVDPLTVRSCLYLLSLQCLQKHSEKFSVELLDMLIAFSSKVPTEIGSHYFKVISDLLEHIQRKLIEGKYSFPTEVYRSHCLEVLVALLEKLCDGLMSLMSSPEIPLSCMNLMASVTHVECDKQQESTKEPKTKITVVSRAIDVLGHWLSLHYKMPLLSRSLNIQSRKVEALKELELWNNIISINFKDEVSTTEWRKKFTMDFEAKYKKAANLDQIEYYCTEFEGLERSYPFIAASVETCALEAVSSLCQSKSEAKLFEKIKIDGKFGKLISAIIQKSWPVDRHGLYEDDEEVVFQHLLSWTVAKDIFRLHGAKEHLSERLTQDANERLTKAISVFTAITRQLIDGSIKIRLLNMVLKRRMIFSNLLRTDCLSKHQKDKDNAHLRELLEWRQKEVDSVYQEKKLYDVLLTTIQKLEEHIKVDLQIMEMNERLNLEELPLNSFMDVRCSENPDAPGAGIVTYFNLPQEVREMSLALCRFRESHIFQKFWKKHVLRMVSDDVVNIETIYSDIFLPCLSDYKKTCEALKNGTIRLEMVNKLFKHFNDKYEDLANDLGIMCRVDDATDREWIQKRVEQIKQSHQLHLAVASAKFIKSVKQTLCLRGDFTVLDILLKVETAEFYKEPLNRIDNDLIQAKRIVMEIDEPRKKCLQELGERSLFVNWVKDSLEDINELKVFVDLASISAGENAMDVDRVACFHDAVLGYSSMLFELKPDCGFDTFKETLKKLWRALDNDSNLPKKLQDSARHLEWLKTVKESHGSVELSSLSLASIINSKGIYMISAQGVKTLSLDTALKLQIQEEMGVEGQMRYYSLEDLRELQNKLMLMSGKADQGQNEVERFVEVFSCVQRLAEAFIALYNAGNPLFRLWEAQIKCCLSCIEPITMDFNLENSHGAVIVSGSLEDCLPELCKKIETCLIYWNDFVNKQRSQHYYLNYFTAEQIVYLCSQLSPQNVTAVDEQVLMMLSFIRPNCDPSDLRKVWHELQYDFLTKPEEQSKDIDFQTFAVLPSDLGDLGHSFEEFGQIWNAYMTDMKKFLPNTLDLKTLGKLLELLASMSVEGEGERTTRRELPQGFKIGTPNLIICPQEDVLTSCISIYMSSMQENLPTYDEVLLCNSSTQYEEVELFLRRCLGEGNRGQKIYSLLYGDLLTYEVSSKMEIFFHRMKKQSRKDYRLVLICSSEREYLPSAFSQYKLPMVTQEPLAYIQRYLHAHYVVPADQLSAAAAFKDRLCVGVVSSKRAGVGKSLYVKRIFEKLQEITPEPPVMKCVRMTQPNVDENLILQTLMNTPNSSQLAVFHIDVTSSVQKGIHEFLFKLLILRYLMDSKGRMWKCNKKQLYVIEFLEPTLKSNKNASVQNQVMDSSFLNVFPEVFCQPPKEVLMLEMAKQERPNDVRSEDPLMDDKEFRSEAFQRPYQYLIRFNQRHNLDGFTSKGVEGSHVECLQMLLMYCGILDPSWAELRNFAWFLNLQLKDCETSDFCNSDLTGDILAGFKNFVVDFMILMAKDFATPSLSISDQSSGRPEFDPNLREEDLAPFLIRKRWETEPHPYIFFNYDHTSMTFIGFHLQPNAAGLVDAIDPVRRQVIRSNIMSKALYDGLTLQRVPFNMDFDKLNRAEKIEWLCNVLGIQWPLDPDETYELTTDNVLKMLAIHMRFRCGIPVVIMGETGCGKTRLIKFLCELQRGGVATESMKLVKVHGGTTSDVIYSKVREAENIAAVNKHDYGFHSVLFFDEANTTEDISSIKEVLCDRTIKGDSLTPDCGLEIIAACNPYRKHTDEMIERLESAGLGYKVRAEETDEKLGSIPLRQLVYRVHALPPSMIPLVWDFGQLNDQTEKIYIHQIVKRVVESKGINQSCIEWITEVLSASQRYMRTRKDECSFVSLRDVERCMKAFTWFYDKREMFFEELGALEKSDYREESEDDHEQLEDIDPVLWSLIIAVGVCYHACLENKEDYRKAVSACLQGFSAARISQEISVMQDLLLSGVPMGETIAKNCALKENVFMMVICIELRIPLFLVGKPGSSKSLSKTLVADAMQGQASHSDLYKELKQIHLVSFQCSPHSTPEGIINTFKQCGRFQEGKNLDEYISVVVLDEIGLAEDSPKMPLKTLHPLLEEGCIDDEPLPHKKVGFIGISNWALDPAKMNRGIFVSRADPDEKELIESAKGICSSDIMVLEKVQDFFHPFAKAYLKVCHEQGKGFFGLRDYYSLIKMIFGVAKAANRKPNAEEIVKAVLRNFSGRDDVDTVSIFTETLQLACNVDDISAIEFVRENLQAVGQEEECRYLLVLTKNYAALKILQQTFFSDRCQPEIIFGSSFPKDQEYTQICRNINRVKICMETGQTVVLLNLQNLYESLYDALNQYYVYLGGQKYVDLGLGTHRVKCRVHKDFRLIVIEERGIVYKQFPIPLINRLEKHYLDIHTVLKPEQKRVVEELEEWVQRFVSVGSGPAAASRPTKFRPPDVFIGYHSDTCASVVLQVVELIKDNVEKWDGGQTVLEEAKLILLRCATPDSVVRLDCSELPKMETQHLSKVYFEEQRNSCLADFIQLTTKETFSFSFVIEVTTFSRLLTESEVTIMEQMSHKIELFSLQQFDTEQSFLKKIRNFLTATNENDVAGQRNKILIIQCDFDEATHSSNLIASAKYSAINEINKITHESMDVAVLVYFITRLPRIEGGTSYVGFHGGPWRSVHIDDLRSPKDIVPNINSLKNMTISQMFGDSMNQPEAMEVEDLYSEQEEQSGSSNPPDFALDTTALVRSCVQNAVSMLRDQMDDGRGSTRRLMTLLTLLSDDNELKGEFLQTLKKHLHSLLATRDGNTFSSAQNNWVIREASNIDALQEGGTFRHTLWKRIQAVVAPVIAQLVSVIDRDRNLDLLLDKECSGAVKRLWLDIFADEEFLKLAQLAPDTHGSVGTFIVQNSISKDPKICCCMPFSGRIKDYLEELWVHARHNEGHSQQEFDEMFSTTPLGRYIAKADLEMQGEFFQRYLEDFIFMTMKVTSTDEQQILCYALNSCVNELRTKLGATDKVLSLAWVNAAYQEFKNRLQNFSRIISLEPQVTQDLLNNPFCKNEAELVLDVYAAFACVEYLEPNALDTDAKRQAWLTQIKKLKVPVELIFSRETVRSYGERSEAIALQVKARWSRIFSLSLFVEHMFEDITEKLAPLILETTSQLGQVLTANSDLKTQQPFEAVIMQLKNCKDRAVERIFKFGIVGCPVCLADPVDPVVLPCQHIYCLACIKDWLIPGQMYCPYCRQEVDDDFALDPSDDIRAVIAQHAHFRKLCNAFFIDLVSTVCFKDNSPPCQEVILHLLSFLTVEANRNIFGGDRQVLTKVLSPFDDSVDKSPVIRSVVLKLLLKYSFQEVKIYLQRHLEEVEKSFALGEQDKVELYILYLNCLEDSMFEQSQFRSEAELLACLQDEAAFLTQYQSLEPCVQTVTIDYLQQVARVRLDLDMAATLIVEQLRSRGCTVDGRKNAFLVSVENMCTQNGNSWYSIYLIRKICSQHGMECVRKLVNAENMRWLFPEKALPQDDSTTMIDPYLVCGEEYQNIRNNVGRVILECSVDNLHTICEDYKDSPQRATVYLLLALYREVTALYRVTDSSFHPSEKAVQALVAFIQTSTILDSHNVKSFAQALVSNQLGVLSVSPEMSEEKSVLVELVVHMAAVLLCVNEEIVSPLKQLALAPSTMQAAFLPTMPEDLMAMAQQALTENLQWYYCKNGHPCTVGECQRPYQTSNCPDCGVPVGGQNHIPVAGFRPVQLHGDRTQSGHILGDPSRRDNPDMRDSESLSPVPFTVIRMLTHMAMMFGYNNQPQAISAMIKPAVAEPGQFLLAHLEKDMELLVKCLGKGADDTVTTAHLLIGGLLPSNDEQRGNTGFFSWFQRRPDEPKRNEIDKMLSTKETRNTWETEISKSIISPMLKQLDRKLIEVNALMRDDTRVSANSVLELVYGDPVAFLSPSPLNPLIHNSAVWSCREKVSVVSLVHIVDQNDGKDNLPVLWRFLHKEAELRLVQHLPDILMLQRDLVKKFQNQSELSFETIADFLQSQSVSLKAWFEKRINMFLTTWNRLRVSLSTNGELKIPVELCMKDLDLNSDLKVLLPRRQGVGLCSTALVSYLIALHNDMVHSVDKYSGEETTYKVSPADLADLHVISYELERDLMPLILSNTQYSIEKGQPLLDYDLPKIQKQIVSHFIQGKPVITLNGIPTLVSRQERNYEMILKDVKTKVSQEPLQTLTAFAVTGGLHSYSEVCEALTTLEVALGFLAMTGGDPHMKLTSYLEEVLQMGNQIDAHILKALKMCSLKHCVALWQLLASLKSENLLRLKRDPFGGLSKEYKVALSEEAQRQLSSFFSKISAEYFQLELHDFLVLMLMNGNPLEAKPDWSLKDTLVSYIERKDMDVPPEMEEHFPEAILVSHCVEAWKFTVAFKQEHNPRS